MIIEIRNLHLRCIAGIYEFERVNPRDLFIDLVIKFDSTQVVDTRSIKDTIDYDNIVNDIKEYAKYNDIYLLENMARDILNILQREYPKIFSAEIKISKPQAIDHVENVVVIDSF